MKKIVVACVLVLSVLSPIQITAQQSYYYYHNQRIYLKCDSLTQHLEIVTNEKTKQSQSFLAGLESYGDKYEILPNHFLFSIDTGMLASFLAEVEDYKEITTGISPIYYYGDSIILIPQRSIVVKMQEGSCINLTSLLDSLQINYKE